MKTRGHWPKGRRRNPEDGVKLVLTRTRRALRRLIPGQVSRKALARVVGVSPRTISRWLAGEDYPSARSLQKLAPGWLKGVHDA